MRQIIVFIVCILVLSSFSTLAKTNLDNIDLKEIKNLYMDDDVPTWSVGDYWSYEINTLAIDFYQPPQIISLNLTWDNLKFEVKSIASDTYFIEISGKIDGSFTFDNGAGLKLSGKLYYNRFSGKMEVSQSDLAFMSGELKLKSIALLKEHPISLPIPIPMPMTITFNLVNSIPRPFIDFPLFDGKTWFINETSISSDLKVESIVLKILNIFKPDIPPSLNFDYPIDLPQLFYNASIEDVTVKAGTFSAYNIVFVEGLIGSIYYAPVVGNMIKAQAEFSVEDMLSFRFNGELKDYHYT